MRPSTDLFDLVQTLTKSEKRFFKLSSSLQQGEKNYLKIFDVIEKQDEYDEEEIKETFSNENFIKHLPSEKNHLYRLLLKSLRAYHSDNTVSSMLKEELKNIEILYRKALYRECNKFLEKAKRMAIDHEKFYYLFELLNWEKILLEEAYESGEFSKDIDSLIAEEQEVIEKLRNLAAYHILYSKINYVFRSGGYVRSEADKALVEEISHHPLIIGKNTALSFRAATICYYIQGFCATAKVDKQTALVKFERVKDILDANPKIRKDLPKRYMRTLSNMLTLFLDLGRLEEAETMIKTMRDMQKEDNFDTDDVDNMVFRTTNLAEIRILEQKGEYEEALKVVDKIIEIMENSSARILKEHELFFLNSIASVYFGAGRHKESLQWLNRVLNDNESSLRQDIYSYARLFNLVVHYELQNHDLLKYVIKSTFRYLSRRKRDHDLEVTILTHMKRLAANRGDYLQERVIFQEFKEALNDCLQDESNRIILSHFNYPAWIESKLRNLPFADTVKEMHMNSVVEAEES